MRARALAIAVVGLLAAAAPAGALELRSESGLIFDVVDDLDGQLSNGSIDAYDGAYLLAVNGSVYDSAGQTGRLQLDGRGVKMPEMAVGDLRVRRFVYVPKTGGDYARYLDVVTNLGTSDATVLFTISGNLGSDSTTVVVASSSGDAVIGLDDAWFTTDDVPGGGDPSLAHVVQGTSPRVRASSLRLEVDSMSWEFTATVPAGGRVALLTYAVQAWSQEAAQAEARRLAARPADALVGLDEYLDCIIN